MGLVAPQHVVSAQTRDWTCVSCIARWILYHWAIREELFSKYFWHTEGTQGKNEPFLLTSLLTDARTSFTAQTRTIEKHLGYFQLSSVRNNVVMASFVYVFGAFCCWWLLVWGGSLGDGCYLKGHGHILSFWISPLGSDVSDIFPEHPLCVGYIITDDSGKLLLLLYSLQR